MKPKIKSIRWLRLGIVFGFFCACYIGASPARLPRGQGYVYPLAHRPVTDIFFLDPLHGWVVGEENNHSILSRTSDGGNTWLRISVQPNLARVFFRDAQT